MKVKVKKHWILVALIAISISCSEMFNETPTTLYGLPHVAIEMRESDFVDMRKNDLVNEYAAITIEIGGVKRTGRMRRRGDYSRYFPKPSFHVITADGERHYMAQNIDKSYCREAFAYHVFRQNGFSAPDVRFVALSVNGAYQGLYISREPVDKQFFDRRGIKINSLYKLLYGGVFSLKDGHNSAMSFDKVYPQSSTNYNDLNILLSALDDNDAERITSVLNVENAAKYSFVSSAINNDDGITKNLFICNVAGGTGGGKFEIVPFDMDITFAGQGFDDVNVTIKNGFPQFKNGLIERAEEIYISAAGGDRSRYIADIVNDIRKYGVADGFIDSLKNEISQAYENDPYHRGEDLNRHVSELKRYIGGFSFIQKNKKNLTSHIP